MVQVKCQGLHTLDSVLWLRSIPLHHKLAPRVVWICTMMSVEEGWSGEHFTEGETDVGGRFMFVRRCSTEWDVKDWNVGIPLRDRCLNESTLWGVETCLVKLGFSLLKNFFENVSENLNWLFSNHPLYKWTIKLFEHAINQQWTKWQQTMTLFPT